MTWTQQKEERLRALWNAGKTASEISDEIGFGRSAVIGKARRLGLEARRNPAVTHREKFERLIDYIVDRPDEYISIDRAAFAIGMNIFVAERMWKEFIVRFAYHPTAGLELYK